MLKRQRRRASCVGHSLASGWRSSPAESPVPRNCGTPTRGRGEDNAKAVEILHQNEHLWRHVGGPYPESLFAPSADALERCRSACETLERLREVNDGRDGLDEYVAEIRQAAVGTLKSPEWEAIRSERFSMTPPARFSELVRNAESLYISARRSSPEGKRGWQHPSRTWVIAM